MKKRFDIFLFIAILILILFGILMIYSSSSIWANYKFDDSFYYVKRQIIFFIIGIFLMLFISKVNYKIYYRKANVILLICFILLILVIIPGIGSIRNGSRSWFGIGSFGIQPSEAAKLGMIIFTSKYLTNSNKFLKSYKKGVFPILIILFLLFGLIMLQPDLGTGVILVISIISLLFIAGVNMKFFIGGGVIGIIGIIILIIIAPYRMDRITSFINPWKDPLGTGFQIIQSLYAIGPGGLLGSGYQIIQSLYAIGPGGLLGMGLGNSIQKHFYLPEPQTDFIFSIVSEEFGIMGVILVVGLFSFIIYRGIKISLKCRDSFSKYLSFGMTFQLAFQTLMNLMVVIGMIPVTGVTLPFISYGGSSLLITLISMGIILNISRYNKKD